MTDKLQLKENVLLMDASHFSELLPMCRKFLSDQLRREIAPADLVSWVDLMATDAGVETGASELQVILIRRSGEDGLAAAQPSAFAEFDGKSTMERLRELSFSVICSEELAQSEEFFLDVMSLIYNSGQVKQLLLLPNERLLSAKRVADALDKLKTDMQKADEAVKLPNVSMYGMQKPATSSSLLRWEGVMPFMVFAFGVSAEESAALAV